MLSVPSLPGSVFINHCGDTTGQRVSLAGEKEETGEIRIVAQQGKMKSCFSFTEHRVRLQPLPASPPLAVRTIATSGIQKQPPHLNLDVCRETHGTACLMPCRGSGLWQEFTPTHALLGSAQPTYMHHSLISILTYSLTATAVAVRDQTGRE